MENRTCFERSMAAVRACKAATQAIKQASQASRAKQANGFEYISDVPVPGHEFASHKLENDYQMKHPELASLHAGIYSGAAAGVLVGRMIDKSTHGMMNGAVLGGMAGMGAEALHRYGYMLDARKKLEHGQSPIDQRYVL